jgi:hypothetical protein
MKCNNNNEEKQKVSKSLSNNSHTAHVEMDSTLGLVCPRCMNATLEIDSQMNLVCQNCNYVIGGSFT